MTQCKVELVGARYPGYKAQTVELEDLKDNWVWFASCHPWPNKSQLIGHVLVNGKKYAILPAIEVSTGVQPGICIDRMLEHQNNPKRRRVSRDSSRGVDI